MAHSLDPSLTPLPHGELHNEEPKGHLCRDSDEIQLSTPDEKDGHQVFFADPKAARYMKRRGRIHMAVLCWTMFVMGWSDGSPGPLLPRIQQVYHINFIVVSMIFVTNCAGVVIGGVANVYLIARFGFGKTIVLGAVCSTAAFCIQASAPPFSVFLVSYVLLGFGMAFQDIHANAYVGSLHDSSTRLGILHCVYASGAFASPLAATQFAQLTRWSFLYLASVGMGAINVAALVSVFRLKPQEECMAEMGEAISTEELATEDQESAYSQMLRLKALHFLALFILAYVGMEVTIGGWIVTYIIDVRGGGSSSGYISSGFWGGLALGRIILLPVTKKLGNRLAVLLYILLAVGLELIVWLVPSFVGGAVTLAFIGIILGPVYPTVINEATHILPRPLLTTSIGWIAACGTVGSAGVPFLAGLLAQERGIGTLQPLLVSMMVLLVGLWLVLPRARASEGKA